MRALSPQFHPGVWLSGSLGVLHHPCSPGILLALPAHPGRTRRRADTHTHTSRQTGSLNQHVTARGRMPT